MTFVVGKVENSETKEQDLIRECKEELNIKRKVGNVFIEVVREYSDVTPCIYHCLMQRWLRSFWQDTYTAICKKKYNLSDEDARKISEKEYPVPYALDFRMHD